MKIQHKYLFLSIFTFTLFCSQAASSVFLQKEGHNSENLCKTSEIFFISPKNGQKFNNSDVKFIFGSKNIILSPAGIKPNKTGSCELHGHHHLIINKEYDVKDNINEPIPFQANILHFGGGQQEADLKLQPGKYQFQLVLGDYDHKPIKLQQNGGSYLRSQIITIEIINE